MKKSIVISALLALVINSPLACSADLPLVPAGTGRLADAGMVVATAAFMGQEDSSAIAASPWDNALGTFAAHTLVATAILISTAGIVANAAGTSGT